MRPIHFHQIPSGAWRLNFPVTNPGVKLNAEASSIIRKSSPPSARTETLRELEWEVCESHVISVVNALRDNGYSTPGFTPPVPAIKAGAKPGSGDWALAILRAAGSQREAAVYAALVRVFHPAAETGDPVLYRQLQEARAKVQGLESSHSPAEI